MDPTAPPKGEFKGIVKRVRVSGPNLLVTIESGDFLELKVNFCSSSSFRAGLKCCFLVILVPLQLAADGAPPAQKRANDWAVVIKAFTQG